MPDDLTSALLAETIQLAKMMEREATDPDLPATHRVAAHRVALAARSYACGVVLLDRARERYDAATATTDPEGN